MQQLPRDNAAQCTRQGAHPSAADASLQSGFTPGESTTDPILARHVVVEHQREFQQGMLAAYVDLKKAFDSVHCKALWDLLCLCIIPAEIIGLLPGLYSRTASDVKCKGGTLFVLLIFKCESVFFV